MHGDVSAVRRALDDAAAVLLERYESPVAGRGDELSGVLVATVDEAASAVEQRVVALLRA